MTVVDLITVISLMITVFSAGVAVGKILSDHNKNDRYTDIGIMVVIPIKKLFR